MVVPHPQLRSLHLRYVQVTLKALQCPLWPPPYTLHASSSHQYRLQICPSFDNSDMVSLTCFRQRRGGKAKYARHRGNVIFDKEDMRGRSFSGVSS
jgi:hypothetical protein